MEPPKTPAPVATARWKFIARKVVTVAITTLIVSWLYGWASPWAFPSKQTVGFGYGMLHGAMMPIALPSLVLGKDVEIYDADNIGRIYKIGYICGINLCGLVFFGPLFYRPKSKQLTSATSDKSR